jgi:ATP-dependent Clp protease ATP-binding subunit ClpA
VFERFTTEARQVVLGAVVVAGELDSPTVGTGHLLVALAGGRGRAGQALRAAGATGERLRAELASRSDLLDGAPAFDPGALASIGIDVEEVRRAVEDSFGPGALETVPSRGRRRGFGRSGSGPGGHRRFTAESKAVLERSLREALALRDRHIGAEHVLLGLLGRAGSPPQSASTGLLAACAVDPAALRATVTARRAG